MEKKTNIILITIDCLRADYCGWLNPEKKALTPFLNKLAQKSLIFTQTYTTGPRTCLAFPGILTGTYPLSFEGWDKKSFPGLEQRPYLPEILHNNGYFNITVHDNPSLSAFFGYDRGFDVFKDSKERNRAWRLFNKKKKNKRDGKNKKGNPSFSYAELFFQKLNQFKWYNSLKYYFLKKFPVAYDFLKNIIIRIRTPIPKRISIPTRLSPYVPAQKINEFVMEEMRFPQNPWFLWIHYMEPHEPYFPPKEILPSNISENDLKKINIQYKNRMAHCNLKKEDFKFVEKLYQLNIRYLDHQISQLFDQLKEKIKDSLIIITADHGQEFGEHGGAGHTTRKNNSKLYKELLNVPLIIMPCKNPKIINDYVSSAQIPATILEMVGIKPPPEMQPSLFGGEKIKIFSETLLESSPLWDEFDLSTRQEIVLREWSF